MLDKITYAGVQSTSSYQQAQENLKKLAEFYISTSHIQRLTTKIAKEFDGQNTCSSDLLEDLPEPNNQDKIEVASISVDGGRTQIREENSGPGVHNPRWIEPKVACLQILDSQEHDSDPHPSLPKIFQDKESVKHMVEGLKGKRNNRDNSNADKTAKIAPDPEKNKNSKNDPSTPKILKKFVVADIDKAESFGYSVYRKAYKLNLQTAARKAYLGDGDRKLWSIYEENFRADEWTPILDFIHAVEYAYEAAKLSTDNEKQRWAKYMNYVTHLWGGRPLTIIRRLDKTIKELNNSKPRKSKTIKDKIENLEAIKTYFKNNFTRMDYPEYRKKGLPISSCHVESLIKQFNIRIKSSEKFWNQSAVKGIIKIKAALLSNDNSWNEFWENRYEHQLKTKRNYFKKAA